MKKLSRIFLTIGGVFHIVNGAAFLTASVILTVFSIVAFAGGGLGLFQFIQERSGDEAATATAISVIAVAIVYLCVAIVFVGCGIVSFIASKVTFKARNIGEKANFVAAIVFGALMDVTFGIAGGILGIIAENKEKGSEKEEPKEIETAEEVVK